MKKVWKWWWVWQDREHEEWLAAQSRRGLHLRSVDRLIGLLHRFEQGAGRGTVSGSRFALSAFSLVLATCASLGLWRRLREI